MKIVGRRLAACIAALAGVALFGAGSFDSKRYLDDVKFLASEEMRGRGTGTPELEKAAAYIARQFRAIGLQAPGDDSMQPFQVTVKARIGPHNRLEYAHGANKRALRPESDFVPFNFSSSGAVAGGVVFAGYGITASEYNYDDYAGLDVKGKLVLVLRHEPQESDEKSVFAGKIYTRHAQFDSKAINAKMHGARGVILVNDIANHPGDADQLEKFGRTAGPSDTGIAFAQVRADVAEDWLAATGKNLKDLQESIDHTLKPQSFALPVSLRVEMNIDVPREMRTVHNVAGYLPGETSEYVIVGAHYDHLGLGEQFSLAPSLAGTPHLGADDNASGTAGVLELARFFAAQPKQKRGILFLTFAGEELGLLGSGYYVEHPRFPLDKAVAMINLDMIGRLRDNRVIVGGAGSGSSFKALLDRVRPRHALTLDYSDTAGYGSSDHTSFTTRQVPVMFFFSGLHADYHKPSDTWDKIDAPGAVRLLALVADVMGELASGPDRPQFVRVAEPKPISGGSSGSGYGPSFGSIPDMADNAQGVRFADVREGSPAAKAGLRGGDILFEFDGKKIQNLYDFTFVLREKKPGDTVVVKVLRGGQPLEVKVLLEARR